MRDLFAFIILLIWLTFGAWFYTCKVKKLCVSSSNTLNKPVGTKKKSVEKIDPVDLKKAYSSVFDAEKGLDIKKSVATIGLSDEFKHSADGIAEFLKKHPKTQLNITGLYDDSEINDSGFDNIGIARAEMVRQHLMQRGVSENQLNINSLVDNEMFDEAGNAINKNVIDFKFSEEYDDLNKSDIKQAYKSAFVIQDYIYFQRDSNKVVLKENFDKAIDGVEFYLNGNAEHNLQLEVDFQKDEASGVDDMDIGFVRAFDLKQKLVQTGLQKSRILINSKEGYDIFDENKISKPEAVNFNFIFPNITDEDKLAEMEIERNLEEELTKAMKSPREDAIKDSIRRASENLVVADETVIEKNAYINFEFASDVIIQKDGFEQVMTDLKAYLKKFPAKQVEIIGHTCNMGDNDFNMMLGRKRAEAAKQLLANHGISVAKVVIKSKGEYAPAFSNETKSGRMRNRRVEIDIK